MNDGRKIDRFAAQDAYWYAECVEEDGHGDTFQAGPGREFPTVLAAWRRALEVTRAAGIDLGGLNLVRGKLPARGRALRRRISEACAQQGILASMGETLATLAKQELARAKDKSPERAINDIMEWYSEAKRIPPAVVAQQLEELRRRQGTR